MAWRGSRLVKTLRLAQTFAAPPGGSGPGAAREARQWCQWHTPRARAAPPPDEAWDERLHGLLGAPWPCQQRDEFDDVMSDIGQLLAARGWGLGRDTYAWYADGDAALCRTAWCVTLHARPAGGGGDRGGAWCHQPGRAGSARPQRARPPVERGPAFPLRPAAARRNRRGGHRRVPLRWTYLEGASRQRLPTLVSDLGQVDLFIHDSLHTAANTKFEMEQVASAMRPGGVMLVDDIDTHDGFTSFAAGTPSFTPWSASPRLLAATSGSPSMHVQRPLAGSGRTCAPFEAARPGFRLRPGHGTQGETGTRTSQILGRSLP